MKKRRIIHTITILMMAVLLLSCSESDIGTGSNSESLITESANAVAAKKSHGDSPQKVFSEFQEMVRKVEKMSNKEIDSLSDEEILKLGEPILKATENTVKLSKTTLQRLEMPLRKLAVNFRSISKGEHQLLSKEIEAIITSTENFVQQQRNLTAKQIKEMLLGINGVTTMSSTCEQLFTMQGDRVILMPGNNFNLANSVCPAGTLYYITGTHYGQSVTSSKTGNSWVGAGSAVMNGQGSVNRAFSGGMDENSISWFEIKNYAEYGMYSSNPKQVLVRQMVFENISPNKFGQYFGAIRFDYAEDIEVSDSYFEDVASSVRFSDSNGPLVVVDNEALNTGRNFFQCGRCSGGGIRINGNSMEHTMQYGTVPVEDFINIFESDGLSNDYIQVNNNRARTNGTGSGVSNSGSFIILGDSGGKFQEAKNNIGVNTGNAGIGAAGGEHIKVIDNKMYSDPIATISNVAFYSGGDPPCNNHEVSGNVAHWYCYQRPGDCGGVPEPYLNRSHAPSSETHPKYCGITISEIRNSSSVLEDTTMGPGIWNEW